MSKDGNRAIALWLLVCSLMVFAALVVGGTARLAHLGLSSAVWAPVGASIGAVFFLPFIYFLMRGQVDSRLLPTLAAILLLGATQAGMDGYMARAGLVDDPRLGQYRLTAHLGFSFLIFAALFWLALGLLLQGSQSQSQSRAGAALPTLRRHVSRLTLAIFVTALSGGIVAGLAYDGFPLMHGSVVPPDMFVLEPWFINFFNNRSTAQFDHRIMVWALAVLVPLVWYQAGRAALPTRARLASHALLLVLLGELALGIAAPLFAVSVPLAVAHQGGALLLFGAALWLWQELRLAASSSR